MSEPPKPCPFCGGEAHRNGDNDRSPVMCDAPSPVNHTAYASTVGDWNRRALSHAPLTSGDRLLAESAVRSEADRAALREWRAVCENYVKHFEVHPELVNTTAMWRHRAALLTTMLGE